MKRRLWTKVLVVLLAVIISIPVSTLAGAVSPAPTSVYYEVINSYENDSETYADYDGDILAGQGGDSIGISALSSDSAVIVPHFLPGVTADDLTVTIFNGTLPWTTNLANIADPNWMPPGGISRLGFDEPLGGFVADSPGLFTVVSHGTLEMVRGHQMAAGLVPYGGDFHTVVTYLHITQAQIDENATINLLIESNRRSPLLSTNYNAARPNRAFGPYQTRGWIHEWESLQNSNSANNQANHMHQVRLPSYQDRYDADGNWTIAAFDGQALNTARTSANRFALGSPVAPWSGPNHFNHLPSFSGNEFCPDTGWLINNSARSLYQWTTHTEMVNFINGLNNRPDTGHMYLFNAGFAPHAFTDITDPYFFCVPFVVFSSTDLSAYAANNDWAGAGLAIQANGRPTVFQASGHHGNEHSGREAVLAVMHSMATTPWGQQVVQDVNVILYPDYSPTGHRRHSRYSMTVSGVRSDNYPGMTGQAFFDMNRDHHTLHTQEVYQARQVWMAFMPHVMLDGHELTGWNYTAAGVYTSADDFQISASTTPNTPGAVIEIAGEMLRRQFSDAADSGVRIAHFGNTTNPTISRPFYGHMAAASYVLETRGQVAGLQARRTYVQYMSARSFIEFLRTDGNRVRATVDGARDEIVEMGRIYDPARGRIALHSAAIGGSVDNRLPTAAEFNRFNLTLAGGYTAVAGTSLPMIGVSRDRSRPTGYVMLLGEWDTRELNLPNPLAATSANFEYFQGGYLPYSAVVAQLRRVLSGQNIDHYFLPEGTVLPLNQYYVASTDVNPHSQSFLANYRATEYVVIPAGGAYFIPMDQPQGTIIALTMEPDVRDAAANTGANPSNNFAASIVQMMVHSNLNNMRYDGTRTIFHCAETMNFPIFRFTEDNPRNFVTELTFNIFNNGNNNNASLANAGLIRMWPQLGGAGVNLPYADLTVTAYDQDGNDAMAFVRINRIWNNTDYVSLIDVNKHASWQHINFTAAIFGQTVEVLLINNMFLGLHAFNNGTCDEVPSMAGNIRIWPQLGGSGAPIPMSAVITAVDQDGNDAMAFVTSNRLWNDGAGWQDYYANFDVSKNAPWQHIAFTVTVYGQTVELLLINNLFVADVFGLHAFNNGTCAQVPGLAGTIRIWTQINEANALVPYAGLSVTAYDQDGNDAMQFIRVNRIWNNMDYVNLMDVTKQGASWQYINLTVTLNNQSVELLLINNLFVADVFGLHAFNNGTDAQVPGLAGTIRIWAQINGANALVPYAGLSVTAYDQDGNDAMQFIRVNRIWNNMDYVNLMDVTKRDAPWQHINLTVMLNNQPVELLLINNTFAP